MTSKKSGDGERTAMLGYVPQYEIAAGLIYDALLDGCLEWVRVADPDAGSVDDILISTTGRVDAYQVKWAEYTNAISFSDFVLDGTTKSGGIRLSLFRQLVEGWKTLNQSYPEKDITVHLAHKHVPSSNVNAKLPLGSVQPEKPHFQAFLKDCWFDRSWANQGLDYAPIGWSEVLSNLHERSGLSVNQFLQFIGACELKFNYKQPNSSPVANQQLLRREEDIENIFNLLTKMAGGEKREVELSKDQLLNKLNWSSRFEHKFVHEFPVDDTYQEITKTVGNLSDLLDSKKQGYIALLGSPGSGKSTTLTKTLKYRAGFKLVRYYAYVPDSTYQGRGEANTFLHDITLSLKQHGFRGISTSQPRSREEYLILLGEQLQQANEKWINDKVMTVIMIDGLDHIQREQNPQQSLLSDLPLPHTIPDGALFVLGSQTLELNHLSKSIKSHIEIDDRFVIISSFDRSSVYSVIESWLFSEKLTNQNKETIFEKCLGHPLHLVYLLQLLSNSKTSSYSEVLTNTPDYQGHIEQNYSIYWKGIEFNEKLVDLFALLSRVRVPINTKYIEAWSDSETVKDFISVASHYFKKNRSEWSFFHNSFRQFILDKTGRSAFGNIDQQKNASYHQTLANYCFQLDNNTLMHWESIFHYFHAGDMSNVIEIGQQDYLRNQYFNLRNLNAVKDNIDYILLAAKELCEPLPVIRCLLIENELRERVAATEEIDVLRVIFMSEGIDSVMSYIFDGSFLRITSEEALSFSKVLVENKYFHEAKLIFDKAEPLGLLSGSDGVDRSNDGYKVLKLWVDVAHYFMPLNNVFNTIYQTKYKDDDGWPEELQDDDLHSRLVDKLIWSIFNVKEEMKIKELYDYFVIENFEGNLIELCLSICIDEHPNNLVQGAFDIVMEWAENEENDLSNDDKLLISEFEFKINKNSKKSKKWLKDLKQPALYKYSGNGRWKNLSPFVPRIRLNRLLSALSEETDSIDAVPQAQDDKHAGNVLFERLIVRFSNIWGKSWKGSNISSSEIVRDAQLSFQLLLKPYHQTKKWTGWYEIESAAVDFFKFMIKAVSQHGQEHILVLSDAFKKDWGQRYWSTEWRREVAYALYEAGDTRDSLINTLNQIEVQIDKHEDIFMRISEYAELSIVWSKIDEPDRSKNLVPKIFYSSFDIYHRKDRQFSHWVSWLKKFVEQYPEKAEEDIKVFASTLVSLSLSGNGRGTQEAARDLIAITASWNVENSLYLIRWLFNNQGLEYSSGLTGFLSGMLQNGNASYDEISIAISKLLIPFEEDNSSDLPELFASKFCISTENELDLYLTRLIQSIKAHALPSNRHFWFEGLAHGLRNAGKENSKLISLAVGETRADHRTYNPSVKLKNGVELINEDAQLKVNSIESLFYFIQSIESVDYFHWSDLIKPYLKSMNVDQLDQLCELLQSFSPEIGVFSEVADAYMALGNLKKASRLINGLLEKTSASGWDLHWDGGSRQKLFKTLISIDSEKWREKALNSLVDDYISEFRYPSNLIWNLEEIVDILFDGEDVFLVWQEIKNHIYQLSCFMSGEQTPTFESNGEQVSSDTSCLIRFSFDIFDVIIPELSAMAHQTIVGLSAELSNKEVICEEIRNRINCVGLVQVKVISLLNSFSENNIGLALEFKKEIASMCVSEDLSVRITALECANKIDVQPDLLPENRLKLPIAYELEFPEISNEGEAIPFSAMRPGETLPDVDDALELLRPLVGEAKLIGEISGISFENIIYRACVLMKSLVAENKWSQQAEEKHRVWMEGVGLKLTYHRLRPQVARLALSHITCELLDAGSISEYNSPFLCSIFRRSDELALSTEPNLRPSVINVPKSSERDFSHKHDVWLDNVDDALPLLIDKKGEYEFVLGELTECVWLDWGVPKEIRMSMVCHPKWPSVDDVDEPAYFFPTKMYWLACEYPHLLDIEQPSLVIYGSSSYVDHGRVRWLALNPGVAFSLGWSMSKEGLFRWVDNAGMTMVESFYWKDGPISRLPPKTDDAPSNGWLVLASPKAVESIRKFFGDMIKVNSVVRSYDRDKSYQANVKIAESRDTW